MVGAARAEFSETSGVFGIHEAEDFFVVLHGADEALGLGNLAAEPREDRGKGRATLFGRKRGVFSAAEGRGVAALGLVFRFDEGGGFLDAIQRVSVAGFFFVIPRDETVLAHHDGFYLLIFLNDGLHREAELKTGTHPGHVSHLTTENFLREFFAVFGSRDRDDRVGVHVIDEFRGQETVQWGVDRGSAGVEVERGVRLHAHHVVFSGSLQALVGTGSVELLHIEQFLLIKRGEIFARAGAKIAAGAFDPEHFCGLAGERIFLGNLGRGVAATGVGDALVAAENVGAIDKAAYRIEGGGFGVVPKEVHEFIGFHGGLKKGG